MTRDEKIAFLREHLTPYELWGQFSEEACELAQSGLKMQRLSFKNNPPRKSFYACVDSVIEEHADLALCFEVLGWNDKDKRHEITDQKLDRWVLAVKDALSKEAV